MEEAEDVVIIPIKDTSKETLGACKTNNLHYKKIYTNKFASIVWTNYQILTSERSQIVYELCVVLENRVPSWEVLL